VAKNQHRLALVFGLIDELGEVGLRVNEGGAAHVVMMVHIRLPRQSGADVPALVTVKDPRDVCGMRLLSKTIRPVVSRVA
jgi:hypothetical protein